MIDTEAFAGTGRELAQILAEQADMAALRSLHTAEQAEQGGLAAAAGALEKQGLARRQGEMGNIQQLRLARPGEAEIGEFDQRLGHGFFESSFMKSRAWWPDCLSRARGWHSHLRSRFVGGALAASFFAAKTGHHLVLPQN